MPQNYLSLPGGGVFDAFQSAQANSQRNALMMEERRRAEEQAQAAQGMANTQNKIQTQLASGNRDAAASLAQSSGSAEIMASFREQVAQLDEAQLQEAARRSGSLLSLATGVMQVPEGQRSAWVQQNAAALADLGLDVSQIGQMDLSDANLVPLVRMISAQDEEVRRALLSPTTLGENESRIDPLTGQQTVGQAGIEARGLESRGLDIQGFNAETTRQNAILGRDRLNEDIRQFDVGQAAPRERRSFEDAQGIRRYEDTGEPVFASDVTEVSQGDMFRALLQQEQYMAAQIEDLNAIIQITDDGSGVGASSQVFGLVRGSQASDVRSLLDSVTGAVALERLEQMRDMASQSGNRGSGLGQVTEREIAILRAARGALSQDMSSERFNQNARRLLQQLQEVRAERRRIIERDFPELAQRLYSGGGSSSASPEIDPLGIRD